MISVAGMSTNVALRIVNATEDKQQEMIRSEPQHARAIEYFMENISDVQSVDDLMEDYDLYSFVMKAYDLEDQIFGKAMMEKILKSDIEDRDALVNKLTDSRFKDLYTALGFGAGGEGNINTLLTSWKTSVVDKYVDTQFVNAKTDENETLGAALAFRRKAGDVNSAFDILRDTDLSKVVRTVLGLPASMAALDIDKQAALINEKLDLETLSDPEVIEEMVTKYVAISDATSGSSTTPLSGAMTILSSASSFASGSFVPVTIDIAAISGFGGYRSTR